MSDHDAAPDPMDKAYAEAEAVLSDEAARAARRARVLAAVANAPAATAAAPTPSERRPPWAPGGWLAAASVAGLSALVALQIYHPAPIQPPPSAPPRAPTLPASAAPGHSAPPAPAARAPAQPPKSAAGALAPRAEARSPAPPVTPPPPAPIAQQPPPPPSDSVSDVVVTSERRELRAPAAPAAAAPARASSYEVQELVITKGRRDAALSAGSGGPPAAQAVKLRDAAAAGRTAEISALLARGAPVDAADDDGETALMKAVQANRPAAAELLRRHGASLDLKNHAGASARDMAARIGAADLNRALGLGP